MAFAEESRAHWEETKDDHRFLREHWNRLVAEHPNRWVAVYRGELLGIFDTWEEQQALVQEMAQEPGIPENRITTTYVLRREKPLSLARMAA